ncbi:MAG: TlpA disulfide reductase family protein, partial [Deltaproteobacteria bacterium]
MKFNTEASHFHVPALGGSWNTANCPKKPLLLYFWASWCKPCRLVSPQIATLAREYKDRI